MAVHSLHPEYARMIDKWCLTRSIINSDAKDFLRVVDINDPKRSQQYKDMGILTNFTRFTRTRLLDMVFRRPPKSSLPQELDYLNEDATGYGFGLNSLVEQILSEVLTTGRMGVLIDPPSAGGVADNTCRFRPYPAESILNWRYLQIGSKWSLRFVVLREVVDRMADDGFEWQQYYQYRVLRIDPQDGLYHQQTWSIAGNAADSQSYTLSEDVVPTDFYGNPFTEIPFEFCGSENNDAVMDTIPLYDMAIVNLGHYRNSCDYEEAIYVTGQPLTHIDVGLDTSPEDFKAANPNGITFGSRNSVTTSGGNLQLVQANPNQLPDTGMKHKQEQIASIGASLVAPPGGRETAEGAQIRVGGQTASLQNVCSNAEKFVVKLCKWAARFMMKRPADSTYELNKEFFPAAADANLIAQEILLFQNGLMDGQEVRDDLDRMGIDLDKSIKFKDIVPPVQPAAPVANNAAVSMSGNEQSANKMP